YLGELLLRAVREQGGALQELELCVLVQPHAGEAKAGRGYVGTGRKEATMLRPLLAVAAVGALTLPVSASSTPGLPELTAKVTARSISLTTSEGQRVERLQPNTYRFIVKDLTSKQNFHLVGPSVNRRTEGLGEARRTLAEHTRAAAS